VTEPATLEPIDYISVEPGNWRAGYVIPDHERERGDAAPLRPGARAITEEARDIAVVVAELEPIVYLDAKLEAEAPTSPRARAPPSVAPDDRDPRRRYQRQTDQPGRPALETTRRARARHDNFAVTPELELPGATAIPSDRSRAYRVRSRSRRAALLELAAAGHTWPLTI
jgi:hypothetical protein